MPSTNGSRPTLSILMPVYNEEATVERAIAEVLEADLGVTRELVIVDDGSTDGTRAILKAARLGREVRVFHHDRNRGKGAAVRTALAEAGGEFSAIFDADLEYSPDDLAALLPPLIEGRSSVSFGVRAFDGYTSHSFRFVLGNKAVTLAANLLYDVYIHDLMTCHKMMRTDLFRGLTLREPGFAIEAEITARLLERGERIFETPISYEARSFEEGKKLTWVDGLRVIRTLLRCRLAPAAHASAAAGPSHSNRRKQLRVLSPTAHEAAAMEAARKLQRAPLRDARPQESTQRPAPAARG